MDPESQQLLIRLLRTHRLAALGTLRDGAPLVSLVLYAVSPDLSCFYIHASRLALHTQDILRDAHVSLMIAETDTPGRDPQTLARVSLRGEAVVVPPTAGDYAAIKSIYLQKFPESARHFELGDFPLYCIVPRTARYVAGFGKVFNLTAEDLRHAGSRGA